MRRDKNFGVLLVNLGSPDSCEVADVRKYLDEFLMDERIIDLPEFQRKLLVKGLILNTRPGKSAAAYRAIWTEEGSPLIVISQQLQEQLQRRMQAPVALGMRYGNPSIQKALEELREKEIAELRLVPLYPHYAMSSYETAVTRVQQVLHSMGWQVPLKVLPPFYGDRYYLNALKVSIQPYLKNDYDQLLFSYHGVPERQVRKSDASGQHCLYSEDCCRTQSEAWTHCYRHQTFAAAVAIARLLSIPAGKFQVSFQSRLGLQPWLRPYTDQVLKKLPGLGVKKLLVVCPSFVADCLETLEEIGIRGRETFLAAGGEELTLIPCLNTDSEWLNALVNWTHDDISFIDPVVGTKVLSAGAPL